MLKVLGSLISFLYKKIIGRIAGKEKHNKIPIACIRTVRPL